ncbi:hypothetical protein A3216_04970 [Mycobacterium leprae 7935681]|nr:hypothetical protein A3216_04970 [Mycobacterium leprae 7935681]
MSHRWVKPGPTTTDLFKRLVNHSLSKNQHAESRPQPEQAFQEQVLNETPRLAARQKTVSFGQCRFQIGTAVDNEVGMADQLGI